MTEAEIQRRAIATVSKMAVAWGADMDRIARGDDYRVKIAAQALRDLGSQAA